MIHVVIGTKAQLVKMGPLMALLQNEDEHWNFIFTGQHHETIRDLRENFNIRNPDITLHEGSDIKSIPAMIFWIFKIIAMSTWKGKKIFQNDRKGIVLVHGDTFSCLLGAMLGKTHGHRIAHVESGLRSFNLFHPFPEEIVRILTFKLTDIYYCPGKWALKNVRKYNGIKVNTKGNTLFDSLREAVNNSHNLDVEIPDQKYCVLSIHRFENIFNDTTLMLLIVYARMIAKKMHVIFILHPPTERRLQKMDLIQVLEDHPNIELRPRYDYFRFIKLVSHSEFLATDGGSNQEECYYMNKPCLILRKHTERKEGLGENAFLSKNKRKYIEYFLKNIKKFQSKNIDQAMSPSKKILKHLNQIK